MSNWGLLGGLGRGLSQASQMVGQGLAEDRNTRREQARFDESRRWQQAMENKRMAERAEDREQRKSERAEDMQFRQSESNRQAGQFDRQMSVREKQVIEGNLSALMEQRRKEEQAIVERYQKLGEVGGVTEAMQSQMTKEIKAVRSYYDKQLGNMVSSYGDNIRGTGFEYLLTAPANSNDSDKQNVATEKQAQPQARNISQYVSSIVQPEAGAGAGLMNIDPNYTTDSTGNPELSFSNLMRKWNTPSPNSPALPRAKTAEQIEEEKRNLERVKSSGITSAYGAAMMNQGRN